MKIALFGASGMIGQRIAREALERGHTVRAIVRRPERLELQHENLSAVRGDASNAAEVAALISGYDIVISAIGPGHEAPETLVSSTATLIEGVKQAGVPRLITVGGAGSLEVAPGVQLVDIPEFPAEWKGTALAGREALALHRGADLDWTYLSPAAYIQPGERTGSYRTATETLISDAEGNSRISAEDYAVALLDEVEQPRFLRQRFTVGY